MDGAARLKRWRTDQGLSQGAAAERVGVHQNTWSDWENEQKSPRVEMALRLHVLTAGLCPVEAWADSADVVREFRAARLASDAPPAVTEDSGAHALPSPDTQGDAAPEADTGTGA
jgi:transcriptional regulator with XRE-family HTH domain